MKKIVAVTVYVRVEKGGKIAYINVAKKAVEVSSHWSSDGSSAKRYSTRIKAEIVE